MEQSTTNSELEATSSAVQERVLTEHSAPRSPSNTPTVADPSQPAVRTSELPLGHDFHGLKVHGTLGTGGMGQAFLASHRVLRVPLVIKTFSAASPAQIFREAHLAARVSSSRVVSVLDAGVDDGVPFVVQRYVDGIDLEELLRLQRAIGLRLPVDVVCRLVLDTAIGLRAIHQAGVIHRDVKPANLFLGGDGTAFVGDFGIAMEVFATDVDDRVVGTPQFMAPEQWVRGVIDRRADLYALGATAHLLATNEPPFRGDTPIALGMAHVYEAYVSPPRRDPREAYLFAVVQRMLQKRPDDRYANADDVVRALEVVAQPGARILQHDADRATIGSITIELVSGDLAEQQVDVIVSAASPHFEMNRGVAAALVRVGGEAIAAEARAQRPDGAAMGDVVWSGAGALRAKHVAHAVAAVDGAVCLQRCVLRALLGAEARKAPVVAFPALGTGIGEVPMAQSAKLMLEAFRTFAWLQPMHVRTLRVMLYREYDRDCWREVLQMM